MNDTVAISKAFVVVTGNVALYATWAGADPIKAAVLEEVRRRIELRGQLIVVRAIPKRRPPGHHHPAIGQQDGHRVMEARDLVCGHRRPRVRLGHHISAANTA
jgi:hypothetical protein